MHSTEFSPTRLRSFSDPGSHAFYDPVSHVIRAGDVLFVRSSGYLAGLAQVGAVGGVAGHVMLVIASPKVIVRDSIDALDYEVIWPDGDVSEIWSVRILESTRGEAGLHESEVLMRLERRTGRLVLFGDANDEGTEYGQGPDEEIEVWRSPSPVRDWLHPQVVAEVVADMKKCEASWSLTTAMRAVFRSANTFSGSDRPGLLAEITGCWHVDPICTSVVIIFWQRFLCQLPGSAIAEQCCGPQAEALDLILKFMPLKADRGLPGELLQTMLTCGWVQIQQFGVYASDERIQSPGAGPVGPTSDCVRPATCLAEVTAEDVMAEVAADVRLLRDSSTCVATPPMTPRFDEPTCILEHEPCSEFDEFGPAPGCVIHQTAPFVKTPRQCLPLRQLTGDTDESMLELAQKSTDQIVSDVLGARPCGAFKSEYQDSFANHFVCVAAA